MLKETYCLWYYSMKENYILEDDNNHLKIIKFPNEDIYYIRNEDYFYKLDKK